MSGEINLHELLKAMEPKLHEGEYVFCTVAALQSVDLQKIIFVFKEEEGITIIIEKKLADKLQLSYSFVAAWITLTVHSSLEAVGFTAAFATALAKEGVSCNVVAAFYHDHIFINKNDTVKAMNILTRLSER